MKPLNQKINLISGIALSIIMGSAIIVSSQAQNLPSTTPTQIKTVNWQNTRIPDWNQITFSTMPLINTDGSFQAPPRVEKS